MQPVENIPEPVRTARRLLQREYKSASIGLKEGLMYEGERLKVGDVFVDLVLLRGPDLRSQFDQHIPPFDSQSDMWRVEHAFSSASQQLEHVALEELFPRRMQLDQEERESFRVLALACAGCGKTMIFTKHAPLQWAEGELWIEYVLVVSRKLHVRSVRDASSVSELFDLRGHGMEIEPDRQAVTTFVSDHPERVCLILDGLDETSMESCSSFVQEVIRGEKLKGISLILTSRPCDDVFTLSEMQPFNSRLEVVGFSPEVLETYVRNVLHSEEADELLRKVHDDSHLASMMCTPFIAMATCRLYRSWKLIPRCVSDIFERMILHVVERRGKPCNSWTKVPEVQRALIIQLSEFAFHMLLKQQLVFTDEDLRAYGVSDDAVSLGLLVSCDHSPFDLVKYCRFSHLTLQEYLSVKFVLCSGSLTVAKITWLVELLGPLSGHVRTFWVLLAGQLDHECLEYLVNALLTREKTARSGVPKIGKPLEPPAPSGGAFPMNFLAPLCSFLRRDVMNCLASELLTGVISAGSAPQYIENNMPRHKEPSESLFLETLLHQWTDHYPNASGDLLICAVHKFHKAAADHCRGLCLAVPAAHSRPLEDYKRFDVTASNERRQLVFSCFAENALLHQQQCKPLADIQAVLKFSRDQDAVELKGSDESPARCRMMGTVLQYHASAVHTLGISGFTPSSPSKLPEAVRRCSGLVKLSILWCSECFDAIAHAVQQSCQSMKSFQLMSCEVSLQEWSNLNAALQMCNGLNTLFLKLDNLSLQTATQLAEGITAAHSLRQFTLSDTPLPCDAGFRRLAGSLSLCSSLDWLTISGCHLTGHHLVSISLILTSCPSLRKLDLRNSTVSQVAQEEAEQLAGAVCRSSSLSKLVLPRPHPSDHTSVDVRMCSRLFYEARGGLIFAWGVSTEKSGFFLSYLSWSVSFGNIILFS